MHQRLGLQGVVGRLVAPPGAAMNENVDRRTSSFPLPPAGRERTENVEVFVFARPVSDALWRAEDAPRPFARGDAARDDHGAVRRIDLLVVGVVERLLVHVAPDEHCLPPCSPSPRLRGEGGVRGPLRWVRTWWLGIAATPPHPPRFARRPLPAQRGEVNHPRFNSLKKSLPLSSMTMKAGKSTTSMRQIASMPSSGYSTVSTFLMQCSARFAAAPPIEAR